MPLGWRNKEGFSKKLKRITDKIDGLSKQGHRVYLSGTSAGASAVLAAYAVRPNVGGIITIAGKIYHPETISRHTQDENPDFFEAATLIQDNLKILSQRDDIKNILCIYCPKDKTVPHKDAVIPDGTDYRVPGWNHGSGIFFGVILGAPAIARFIRSRSR